MKRAQIILVSIALSLSALAAGAANQFLKVDKVSEVVLHPGKTAEFSLPVEINSGFHIQANPTTQKNLIPTALDLKPADGIVVEKIQYPAGHPYRLQNSDSDISAYEGKVKIDIFAKATSLKAAHELQGRLKFQACNDKTCFFPTSVPVKIAVRVRK